MIILNKACVMILDKNDISMHWNRFNSISQHDMLYCMDMDIYHYNEHAAFYAIE